MQVFLEPTIEIQQFTVEDVISASGGISGDAGTGSGNPPAFGS